MDLLLTLTILQPYSSTSLILILMVSIVADQEGVASLPSFFSLQVGVFRIEFV